MSERNPTPLADLLAPMLGRLAREGGDQLGPVWARVAGPLIARQTTVIGLEGTLLRVRAHHPRWAAELGKLEQELVQRLNAALGKTAVTQLRIEVP